MIPLVFAANSLVYFWIPDSNFIIILGTSSIIVCILHFCSIVWYDIFKDLKRD